MATRARSAEAAQPVLDCRPTRPTSTVAVWSAGFVETVTVAEARIPSELIVIESPPIRRRWSSGQTAITLFG